MLEIRRETREDYGAVEELTRRLCDKGLFKNEGGTVTSLISRQEFYAMQSRKFVADVFDNSLPAFIAAFTKSGRLTPEEAKKIHEMIDQAQEE